jgi:hypothetical protein
MFRSITFAALALTAFGCGSMLSPVQGVKTHRADSGGTEFTPLAQRIFIPKGFDDNDQIQIVLDGWLDNSCETALTPKIHVDINTYSIEVIPRGLREEGVCAQVRRRFTSIATFGVLPHGTYRVYTNDRLMDKELIIDEASSAGPDDFIYAQIDRAWVDFAPELDADSRWSVVLEGRLTNSCQKLEEVRVIDSGDTVEILPITKMLEQDCQPVETPFVERAFIPDYTKAGRYLLHVRSANGSAINDVFSTFGGVE